MKIMDDFRKPSCAYHKIDTFRGEQRWMEGCGKSMKNALYVQQYGKRHLSGWSDVEQWKNKPVALGITELCESEDIRQAGRQ